MIIFLSILITLFIIFNLFSLFLCAYVMDRGGCVYGKINLLYSICSKFLIIELIIIISLVILVPIWNFTNDISKDAVCNITYGDYKNCY